MTEAVRRWPGTAFVRVQSQGFVDDKVVLEEDFIMVLRLAYVNIIPTFCTPSLTLRNGNYRAELAQVR